MTEYEKGYADGKLDLARELEPLVVRAIKLPEEREQALAALAERLGIDWQEWLPPIPTDSRRR